MKDTFYEVQYGKLKEVSHHGYLCKFEAWKIWVERLKGGEKELKDKLDELETQIGEIQSNIEDGLAEMHRLIDALVE